MKIETSWVSPPQSIGGLDHLGTQAPCVLIYEAVVSSRKIHFRGIGHDCVRKVCCLFDLDEGFLTPCWALPRKAKVYTPLPQHIEVELTLKVGRDT